MRVLLLVWIVAACSKTPAKWAPPSCDKLVPASVHDQFFKDGELVPPRNGTDAAGSVACFYASSGAALETHRIAVDCTYEDAAAVTANLGKELKSTDGARVDGLGDGAFVSTQQQIVEGHFGPNCDITVSHHPTLDRVADLALAKAIVVAYKP